MNTKMNMLSLAVLAAINTACVPDDKNSSSSSSSGSGKGSSSSSSSGSGEVVSYINVKGGFFTSTALGSKLYPSLNGHSNLVISQDSSDLEVHVMGLTADATYQSSVNDGTCDAAKVGPYYQQKSSIDPVINVDRYGMGMGLITVPFAVRETSLSLVIKELGDESVIACADLNSSQGLKGAIATGGSKSYFHEGTAYVSAHDSGRSSVEISANGTFDLWLTSASVNKTTCGEAAQHYLQNVAGADVDSNGLSSTVTSNEFETFGWASYPFKVRLAEIKSLVMDGKISLICYDLNEKLLMFRRGNFKPTDAGAALYGTLSGRAILETSEEGVTTATITMSGLKADTTYMNHIHNGLCSDAGGNHYLHQINGADNAVNGMFPVFTADAAGNVKYTLSADKIVRPDARSIVIHEPGSGTKIACADLE